MYRWRLILKEYGPEIVFFKGIHNTVADAVSRLEYVSPDNPSEDAAMHQYWMTFSKCWCKYKLTHNNSTDKHNYSMNNVFANHSKEEEIYPLTVKEIAEAQRLDRHFKATMLKEKYEKTLIKNTPVFCKNGKLVIPGLSSTKQLVGTTIIYNILEIHILKKHSKLLCTGHKCVPLYAHTSKTVDLAR